MQNQGWTLSPDLREKHEKKARMVRSLRHPRMKGAISQFLVCKDTLLGAPFYFPIEAEPKPVLERQLSRPIILCQWGQNIKKKIQIDIYIVLKNYKYSKLLFLNTLRCNHLPTKINNNKIMSFFNTRLVRFFFFFFFVEV